MTFFAQTIGSRLLEGLDLIAINPSVILDLSPDNGSTAKTLRERYPCATMIPLHLVSRVMADHRVDLANDSVDFVCSNLLLPWLKKPEALESFFQEIKRILKPGGLFLFSSLGPDTFVELQQVFESIDIQAIVEIPTIHDIALLMDLHDIGDRLLQTPFEDPVMNRENLMIHYSKPRALLGDLYKAGWFSLLADLQNIDLQTVKSFLRRYAAEYQVFYQSPGIYRATLEVIYGHAWGMKFSKEATSDGRIPLRID